MAQACARCGGTGYGFIDAEFGHRGTDPCDSCVQTLKDPRRVASRAVAGFEGEGELGKPVPVRKEVRVSAAYVDSKKKATPGESGVSFDEAVEKGWIPPEVAAAQEAEDARELGVEVEGAEE